MSGAVVVEAVVREGRIHICDDFYRTRTARAAAEWGEGCALRIRIEPEEQAVTHGQYKHLFGHVFEPVVEWSGFTKQELCQMAKAQFMPDDGRTSLTQLTHDEFDTLIRATEEWLRTEAWEAFVDYDRFAA